MEPYVRSLVILSRSVVGSRTALDVASLGLFRPLGAEAPPGS